MGTALGSPSFSASPKPHSEECLTPVPASSYTDRSLPHTPLSIPSETLKAESSSAGLESRTGDAFFWHSGPGNSSLHQEKY